MGKLFDQITEDNWIKGTIVSYDYDYYDQETGQYVDIKKMCLLGQAAEVLGLEFTNSTETVWYDLPKEMRLALMRAVRKAGANLANSFVYKAPGLIAGFNDDDDTTFTDIKTVAKYTDEYLDEYGFEYPTGEVL